MGPPFLYLQLDQCYFELGELEKTKTELMKAYSFESEELFSKEDPKYLECLNLVGDEKQFQLV